MTHWQINAGMERVELDATGKAEVVFTVSNPGPVDDRATVDIVGSEQTDGSWFTVAEPQRTVPHGGTVAVPVIVRPVPGSPAGTHWLAGRVYSADSAPEENAVLSNRVHFEVAGPPPKPKSKWWLWALIAGALVLIVVGVVLFLVLGGDDQPDGPTPTTPLPTPGALTAPELVSPPEGAVLTNFPREATVQWQPVPGAAQYRVDVECLHCQTTGEWSPQANTTTAGTSHTFVWPGDNEGRWRVTALKPDGTEGATSGWRTFRYRTG